MRIVFASLGSLGDLHPLLALAAAARARGHAPVVAASRDFADYVGRLGFEFRRIRPDFPFEPELVGHLFHPRRGPERLMREQVFPSVRETYADLVAATEGADVLVVGELLYVAPLVAAARGIPWANAILAPTSFLSADDPCVLAPAPALFPLRHLGRWPHRLVFALGRVVTRRWSAPLRAFRRELGFDAGPSPVFEGKHSPALVLALFPAFFAARQADWPPAVRQTGFPFFGQPPRPETDARLRAFLAAAEGAGAAPLVFTLGSSVVNIARDFYAHAVAAAQRLERRAILLVGRNAPPPDLPPSVLALDYAPLASVLPGAAVVVHQGGIGTCAEALRAGVPALVVPFGFDQPDNARRLERLGVARRLRRSRVSAESLATNLSAILAHPRMKARAEELARRLRPEEDLAAALDAIEALGPR